MIAFTLLIFSFNLEITCKFFELLLSTNYTMGRPLYWFYDCFLITVNAYTFLSQELLSILGTTIFIIKLVVSWFIIVWLRLNLFRYRFDQVASYTWHELVIYAVFFLIIAVLTSLYF